MSPLPALNFSLSPNNQSKSRLNSIKNNCAYCQLPNLAQNDPENSIPRALLVTMGDKCWNVNLQEIHDVLVSISKEAGAMITEAKTDTDGIDFKKNCTTNPSISNLNSKH